MRVLFVEDDQKLAAFVIRALRAERHVVDHFVDGREGTIAGLEGAYDVLILDRMLPGNDGLSIIRALRASGCQTPALFLTSMGGVSERVMGLKAGGDDYLVKPFALEELMARVEALARRPANGASDAVLRVHDLELNLLKRSVFRNGQSVDLYHREFDLLEFFMRNCEKVVTRSMLLQNVWGLEFDPQTSVVETHISRLRAKIDHPFEDALIHTVRGVGYRMHAPS